jgi:hypothetical protein
LEPSQFPSESEFLKDFGDLKTEEQVGNLGNEVLIQECHREQGPF